MRHAGIRDAADRVDFGIIIIRGNAGAVAVAGRFRVDPLKIRGGIAEIHPEERADLIQFAGSLELDQIVRRKFHDLARSQVAQRHEIQVRERARFHGDRHGAVGVPFADRDRGPAELVARGNDLPLRHDQQRTGSLDGVHRKFDPLGQRAFPVDQRGDHFRRIEFAVAHSQKMRRACPERFRGKLVDVRHFADGDDGITAQMRIHQQGLVFEIADAADAAMTRELMQDAVEFRAELRIGDIMDPADDRTVRRIHCHPPATGPQMGMIIGSVIKFCYTIRGGDYSEKTAHDLFPVLYSNHIQFNEIIFER